ncbi:hypothetical protein EMGBS15_01710 [Filimonas sp.]|nr:hypothetical protein EMGBS15_01710 [Filimonas sp.]
MAHGSFMGSAYWLYMIWLPLTPAENTHELYSLLERKISCLLLPFIFLLFSKLSTISWKPYLMWFVSGAFITATVSNLVILYKVCIQQVMPALNHVAYRKSFEEITQIHPTYFGMYLCFAMGILWLYGKYHFKKSIWISYGLQIFLFLFLILLMPKSALLALSVLFAYALFYIFQIGKLKKIWIAFLLLGSLCTLYFIFPFVQQRIDEVFLFTMGDAPDVINNSVDMRHLILDIDLGLLKQHWLFGLGPTGLQQQLDLLLYVSSIYAGHALGSFNAHNEYLNQWLSFGLFGFMLFIATLLFHYKKSTEQGNTLYLFLMIILSVTFLTENILSRQHGIVFYSLFTSLFFFVSKKHSEKY